MSIDVSELMRAAAGQWRYILQRCGGLTDKQLDPRIGQPCPKCGGRDRFSAFQDVDQTGGLCCRVCFAERNADGFSAIEWLTGRPFPEVVPMVANAIGFHSTGRAAAPKPLPPKPAAKPVQLERQSFDVVDSDLVQRLEDSGRNELAKLAESLGVSVASLQALGVGFSPDEDAWTFPERTADGEVCGINRRFQDGSKKMMAGHKRGLIFADDWEKFPGPALILEGPSDTAGAITLGACAIGRPAAIVPKAVLPELVTMLASLPKDRGIIVVGENDAKDDGAWPGKDGAIRTARELTEALGRPVAWALPPEGSKDLRHWLKANHGAVRHSFTDALTVATIEPEDKEQRAQDEQVKPKRSFAGTDAADLEYFVDQNPDWLVDGIFTIDEPLLVAARSKGCKTLQLTDLAVALASGTRWLNCFDVPRRRKILFITGESNRRRIAKHVQQACASRGIQFADLRGYLRIEAIEFPCLPSVVDQDAIRADIQQHGIEVVIIDPLYRGLSGVDAARLSEMGAAIKNFQAACAPAMVILSHHVTKSAARDVSGPPKLEDMTGAGVAESCGQWWMVGRNKDYEFDGKHDLCVSTGGREGQSSAWRIVFDEQQWTFEVESLAEYRARTEEQTQEALADQMGQAARAKDERKRHEARQKIMRTLRSVRTPLSRSRIRDDSGLSGTILGPAFMELLADQFVVQRPYRDGANRIQTEGYILEEYAAEYDQIWNSSEMPDDAGR